MLAQSLSTTKSSLLEQTTDLYKYSLAHLKMRVWDRGAGATIACGTGACVVVVAAVLEGRSKRSYMVDLPRGPLEIEWKKEDNHIYMTGSPEMHRGRRVTNNLHQDTNLRLRLLLNFQKGRVVAHVLRRKGIEDLLKDVFLLCVAASFVKNVATTSLWT